MKLLKTTIYIIIAIAALSFIMRPSGVNKNSASGTQQPSCTIDKINMKSIKARFSNKCTASRCMYMEGVAVLNNGCSEPVGVQVKIIGYDKNGNPVASRDLWPASVNNIPPGDYTFSLDLYLEYDPAMKNFSVEPISVKRWN